MARRIQRPEQAEDTARGGSREPTSTADRGLATGLAGFSFALGAAELFAPDALARLIGVRSRPALFRLFGLRECASGLAILAGGDRPAAGLWSRVVGDAIDLGCLAAAFASARGGRARLGFAAANVLAVSALDVIAAARRTGALSSVTKRKVVKSLAFNRSPAECFAFGRRVENLVRVLSQVESIERLDDARSRWTVKGPFGRAIAWDVEIVGQEPDRRIEWRATSPSGVEAHGQVEFLARAGGGGTVVRTTVEYDCTRFAGAILAAMLGRQRESVMKEDLRSAKRLLETGELPTTEGQPHDARDRAVARAMTGGES